MFQAASVDVQGGLSLLKALRDESSHDMNEKVLHAPMPGMLDVTHILELIVDCLDQRSFPQQNLIHDRHERVFHLFLEFGDQVHPVFQQQLDERLGHVAPVTKELPDHPFRHCGHGGPIIDIAWRDAEGQECSPVVDDQMECEPIEPADRRLASRGYRLEDLMGGNASIVADNTGRRINEGDLRGVAPAGHQETAQGDQRGWHQLDKAVVADQRGEVGTPTLHDVFDEDVLEGAGAGQLEGDDDGHNLTHAQRPASLPSDLASIEQSTLPERFEVEAQVVYGTEQCDTIHNGTPLVGSF